MAIIKTVSLHDFREAFLQANRGNQFSYDGLEVLYEFLEGTCTDHNIELDVIGLCCDFVEYKDELELLDCNGLDSLREVENNTLVLGIPGGGYIVQAF